MAQGISCDGSFNQTLSNKLAWACLALACLSKCCTNLLGNHENSFLPFSAHVFLTIGAPSRNFDGMVGAHEPRQLHDRIKQGRHKAQVQLDHFMAVFARHILSNGTFADMIADGPIGKGQTIDNAKLDQTFDHPKGGHACKVPVTGTDLMPEIFNRKIEILCAFLRDIRSYDFSWAGAFQTSLGQNLQDGLSVWPFEIWRVHTLTLLLEKRVLTR
jgi:hypothetical protein